MKRNLKADRVIIHQIRIRKGFMGTNKDSEMLFLTTQHSKSFIMFLRPSLSPSVSPLPPLKSLSCFWPLLMHAGRHICFLPAVSPGELGQITVLSYSWGCRTQ